MNNLGNFDSFNKNDLNADNFDVDINAVNYSKKARNINDYNDGFVQKIYNNLGELKNKRRYKFYKTKLFRIGMPCVLVCTTLITTLKMCNSDNKSLDEVIPVTSVSITSFSYTTSKKNTVSSKSMPTSTSEKSSFVEYYTEPTTMEETTYSYVETTPTSTYYETTTSLVESTKQQEYPTSNNPETTEKIDLDDEFSNSDEYYIDPDGNSWTQKKEYEEWSKALEEETKTYSKVR